MDKTNNSPELVKRAYNSKPSDLNNLLEGTELAIKNSKILIRLRAKSVVTTKIAASKFKRTLNITML